MQKGSLCVLCKKGCHIKGPPLYTFLYDIRYAATALNELITILRQENSEAARCPLLNRLTQTSTIEKGSVKVNMEKNVIEGEYNKTANFGTNNL